MFTKLPHPIIIIVEGDKLKYAYTYFYMPFSTFRNSYPSYEEAFTIHWMASLVNFFLVGDMMFYFEDILQ